MTVGRRSTVAAVHKGSDPVGLSEIAARLGVRPQTAVMWHYRSGRGELPVPMPPHRWTVSGRPVWRWADIEQWAAETGRQPPNEPEA